MQKKISIIGGGPAALLCAAFLDAQAFEITIYEQKKSLGRKFLVAGKGGFNLTHSEPIRALIERYTPSAFLKKALLGFDNEAFRTWLLSIGIPTFVGSSKRIYPEKEIKPIEVLQAILDFLKNKGVQVEYEHQWQGWTAENDLVFHENKVVKSDIVIFALGGASWSVTGSDGAWLPIFAKKNIETSPFQASNCAFQVAWPSAFLEKHEGSPLKNIAAFYADTKQKGELVITRFGLEGNAIYALSPDLRDALNVDENVFVYLDLKPNFPEDVLLEKIKKSSGKTTTQILKKSLKLTEAEVDLLKNFVAKADFLDPVLLARNIKNLPIPISEMAPLDEAISSVGGVALSAVDEHFELKTRANHYCIGEMLDWDAPTGGYLLQACVSMGVYLARALNAKKD